MKHILSFVLSCLLLSTVSAQQVGVGTSTPHPSAALEVSATNKGLLPPRVALTDIYDIATIPSPAAGLLVYNTANAGAPPLQVQPGYYYFTGNEWMRLTLAGSNDGNLQYWDGTQWALVPPGTNGQSLTMCNGIPSWGPCAALAFPPFVFTGAVSAIGNTGATAAGTVVSNGGAVVTARGICYATTFQPTLANSVSSAPSGGNGSYSVTLSGLSSNTKYYVRAYATNSAGTSYGGTDSFTTTQPTAPVLTTILPFAVGSNGATSGGNISSNGGSALLARGIVYSTSPAPTLSSNVITDPSVNTGTYFTPISGLAPNTPYYVRAYATNATGTAYGDEYTFTTLGSGFFAAVYTFDSVTNTSGTTDPTPVPQVTGLNFGPFSVVGAGGPSFQPTASFRFSFTNWVTGATNGSDQFPAGDSTTRYYQVTITPGPGKTLNLSSLSFRIQRSSSGIRQAFVRSSVDGYAASLPASISPENPVLSVVPVNKFQVSDATTTGQDGCVITLGSPAFNAITTPVTFRFYGIHAEAAGGTFSLDNVVFNGVVQ
jgi:hypothetical protein